MDCRWSCRQKGLLKLPPGLPLSYQIEVENGVSSLEVVEMNRLAAILLTSLIFPPISPPTFSNLPAIDGIQARVGTEVGTPKAFPKKPEA